MRLYIGPALFLFGIGCSLFQPREPGPEVPSYCYEEELLRAKVFACVAVSETRAESKACRSHVLETCGIKVTP